MKLHRNLIFSLLLTLVSLSFGQRLDSVEVKINFDRLREDQKRPLYNLPRKLKDYIVNFSWTDNTYGTMVKLNFQILIETYTKVGFEDTYSAQMVVTNPGVGDQIYDKDWKFVYQENDPLYHSENQFNSLTSLIDYYVYWMLGYEMDTYGVFLGNPMFEKAQNIISQGKFSKYSTEWQTREAIVLEFLNPNNRSFRQMKAAYFDALWNLDDNRIPEAKKGYDQAIQLLNDALRINPRNRFVIRFFEAHYQQFPRFWAGDNDKTRFRMILTLDPDPKRQDFYRKAWANLEN